MTKFEILENGKKIGFEREADINFEVMDELLDMVDDPETDLELDEKHGEAIGDWFTIDNCSYCSIYKYEETIKELLKEKGLTW